MNMVVFTFHSLLLLAFLLEKRQVASFETGSSPTGPRHQYHNQGHFSIHHPTLGNHTSAVESSEGIRVPQPQEVLSAAGAVPTSTGSSIDPEEEASIDLTSSQTRVQSPDCSGTDCKSPRGRQNLRGGAGGARPRRLDAYYYHNYTDATTQTDRYNPYGYNEYHTFQDPRVYGGQFVFVDGGIGGGFRPAWQVPEPRTTTTTTTTTTTLFPPPRPIYPTVIESLEQPMKAQKEKCMVSYTVSTLTQGKRELLRQGYTKAWIDVCENTLNISSVSKDQRKKPRWFGHRWWRSFKYWLMGSDEKYEYTVPVPPGCTHPPDDGRRLIMAETVENDNVKSVRLRMVPELYATYRVSPVLPPALSGPNHFGRDSLKELPNCVYVMETYTSIEVGSLRLKASLNTAKVEGKPLGSSQMKTITSVNFSRRCRPRRLKHISWWTDRAWTSNPVVILYVGYDGEIRLEPDEFFDKVSAEEYDRQNMTYLI